MSGLSHGRIHSGVTKQPVDSQVLPWYMSHRLVRCCIVKEENTAFLLPTSSSRSLHRAQLPLVCYMSSSCQQLDGIEQDASSPALQVGPCRHMCRRLTGLSKLTNDCAHTVDVAIEGARQNSQHPGRPSSILVSQFRDLVILKCVRVCLLVICVSGLYV